MATANFSVINARGYYTILDTYEAENEDGVMQTYERDEWDFRDLMDDIRYRGEICKNFPNSSEEWNRRMDARELCESISKWETFGNGNAWTTETNVESVIVMRSGYYEGAVFDYDIHVQTCDGDDFYLSDYDSVDDMIEDYLNALESVIEWKGYDHKWNVGTFKMQKNNIRKWIEKRVENEIQNCEDFCKANCQMELRVSARFSNGETWYSKVG